jgi:glycosyltransferase involved in cell wall biosynthesis
VLVAKEMNKILDSLSVVVPVFNSEQSLPLLCNHLLPVLKRVARQYELVLVNDGSHDRSWETICKLAEQFTWVCGINLMRNYGQHNALLCGIRAAQYDVIITMDDDLQNPPEEIPKLLQKFTEGYDVVYGTPQQEQHGLWRDVASRITKLALQGVMGALSASFALRYVMLSPTIRAHLFLLMCC